MGLSSGPGFPLTLRCAKCKGVDNGRGYKLRATGRVRARRPSERSLKPGREPHFAIMSRPRGTVVQFPCEHPETCEGCQRAALGDAAYELGEFIRYQRKEEVSARQRGLFDQAIYAQWFADEAERTGSLPAADLSGRTPDYVWYRAHE